MAFTKLISTYYQRVHGDFQESDFHSWGLVDETGALTFAGALLADNCPIYQSRIFCTRWNGLDKRDALDSDEYSGSLISLLQEGAAFVRRNSHKGWFKTADSRIELPDYPERAVTEGILNGLKTIPSDSEKFKLPSDGLTDCRDRPECIGPPVKNRLVFPAGIQNGIAY